MPWWTTILTTGLSMAVVGVITLLTRAYVARVGRREAGRDGEAIVLRYGGLTRWLVVGLCLVLGVALPITLIYMGGMSSAWYIAGMWGLAGFLGLVGVFAIVEVFSRSLYITPEAIVSAGLWGRRVVLYEEVVAIVDESEAVRVKVAQCRPLTISKSMVGWSAGVARVKARCAV